MNKVFVLTLLFSSASVESSLWFNGLNRHDTSIMVEPYSGGETRSGKNTCALNASGLYGDVEAASSSGASVYTIEYLYQASVVAGTSALELTNVVMPELDKTIADAVLPHLFDCTTRRRLQDAGKMEAVSSLPFDTLILSGHCTIERPNTDCYVVQGANTVAIRDNGDRASSEAYFKRAVQLALQSNELTSSIPTPLVSGVTFLNDDLQTNPPIEAPVSTPTVQTISPVMSPLAGPVTSTPTLSSPSATISPQLDFPSSPNSLSPIASPSATGPPQFDLPSYLIAPSASPSLSPDQSKKPALSLQPIAIPTTQSTPTTQPAPSIQPAPTRQPALIDSNKDLQSEDSKIDWWAWLLIAVGGMLVVLCCLLVFRHRDTRDDRIPSNRRNSARSDAPSPTRGDPEEAIPYEPPNSSVFRTPDNGSGTSSSASQFSQMAPAPFINNALGSDEEEVSSSEEASGHDNDDSGSYEEEEESYEEEIEEEVTEESDEVWGQSNQTNQQTFGGRY